MTTLFYTAFEIGRLLWDESRKRPFVAGAVGCAAALLTLRLLIAIASLLFGGVPARFAISGNVSIDGRPLESGVVSFESKADKSSGGVAYIQAGRYELPAKPGLTAGTYTVRITQASTDYAAWSPKPQTPQKTNGAVGGREALGTRSSQEPLVIPASIPSRYNQTSELSVTVGRWTAKRVCWNLSGAP